MDENRKNINFADAEFLELPMIPLRGLSVFPNMVLHFDIGREKSINALEKAMVNNQYLDGQPHMDCSNETAALVDKAVKRLVTESYEEAKQILTDNRALLDEIAEHLLLKETITGDELMAFVNAPKAEPVEDIAEGSAE